MLICDFWRQAIIVSTIVGDVQSTIAVHEGQVTITVQTTRTSCSQGNQVTMIDVVDRGCSVTEYSGRVCIHGRRTRRGITTGEYGIEDGNTRKIQVVPSCVFFIAQCMEIGSSDIVAYSIVMAIDCYSCRCLTIRFNQHLAVLSQHILVCILDPIRIFIYRLVTGYICLISLLISIIVALPYVVVAFAILDTDIELTILLVGAIHITDITATEDVTVLTCQLLRRTYCTAVYMHLCLSENVTVGVERTTFTEVVITTTTTEDVAVYLAFEQFYAGFTSLINTFQGTIAVVNA